MSVSTLRFCTLNESTLGEPEQDANSALTELDKGTSNTFDTFELSVKNYIRLQGYDLVKSVNSVKPSCDSRSYLKSIHFPF